VRLCNTSNAKIITI